MIRRRPVQIVRSNPGRPIQEVRLRWWRPQIVRPQPRTRRGLPPNPSPNPPARRPQSRSASFSKVGLASSAGLCALPWSPRSANLTKEAEGGAAQKQPSRSLRLALILTSCPIRDRRACLVQHCSWQHSSNSGIQSARRSCEAAVGGLRGRSESNPRPMERATTPTGTGVPLRSARPRGGIRSLWRHVRHSRQAGAGCLAMPLRTRSIVPRICSWAF